MGKLFITDKAKCMCKFGTAPGLLKVVGHELLYINKNRKMATSKDLKECFYPPGFATCKYSYPPRPCKVMVVKWTNPYKKMRVNRDAYPLMPDSKAVCAVAGSECIEIINEGQVEILGAAHANNATAEHQGDLDPMGDIGVLDKIDVTLHIL